MMVPSSCSGARMATLLPPTAQPAPRAAALNVRPFFEDKSRAFWTLRRAGRGLHEIVRVKQLGLHSALPQYSFALYQPDLSELVKRMIARVLSRLPDEPPPPEDRRPPPDEEDDPGQFYGATP